MRDRMSVGLDVGEIWRCIMPEGVEIMRDRMSVG